MFIDEAFFGLARAGKLENGLDYPAIIRTKGTKDVDTDQDIIHILGKEVQLNGLTAPDAIHNATFTKFVETEDIMVIANGAELIQRPRKLIEKLNQLREQAGFGKLIYLQGVLDPYLIPVLVYAGVSFFDDSMLRIETLNGVRYTMFGRENTKIGDYEANFSFVSSELKTLRAAIISGSLREIIEKFQISSKALEFLRLLDNDADGYVEKAFPRRTRYIKANSLESLRRPDLRRYRSYISTQYKKPETRKIALLLPCSARKPYSNSKSHRKVIETLGKLRTGIHEIIVTSPVGLVPRELERTYPAAFYDIPVIGEWYEDEKLMINSMLESYFSRNFYDHIVAFVTPDLDFIKEHLSDGSEFIYWEKGQSGSLNDLRHKMETLLNLSGRDERHVNSRMEAYVQIAKYQFGDWIESYLSGCKIVRNYNSEMLVKDGKPCLVFNEQLGKFTINKISGQWLLDNGSFAVEIDDFKPTANIYSVGVTGVTDDVRPEDEVVLHYKGQVRGVGIAKMSGKAMVDLKKGVAVKVRN